MKRHPSTPSEEKQVRAMRRTGLPLAAIAAQTGLSKSAVGRIVADMKADARPRANRARAAKEAVILPWLAVARRLHEAGLTRNEIATRLGVPKSVVYRRLK